MAALIHERTGPDPGMIEGNCNAYLTNGSGKRCTNVAGKGTDHLHYGTCYWHGGRTKNHRKNGQSLRALGEAGELLNECHIQITGRTTVEALQDLRDRSAAMVMALGVLVASLDDLTGPDGEPHVWWKMYGEERDKSARVEKIAADLGLEQRRIEVDAATQQALLGVLRDALVAQGHDPQLVLADVGSRLRAIETGGTEQ